MQAGLALLLASAVAAAPPTRAVRPAPLRGVVSGTLRHKACPTVPAGATVSVIGRDAAAVADAQGRFALTLPPGAYSLVIRGQGLVADQRVDEVVVTPGQTHDLGTVEVWPEERPAGCTGALPALPDESLVVATAPDTPALDLPGAAAAPLTVTPEQVWVRAAPGAAPGQVGLQGNPSRDDEDALGPASFAVGPLGSLWVLDALNGRVQRFDARGHAVASFPVGHRGEDAAVEADLAVSDDGHVYVFTDGDPATLEEHDGTGRLVLSTALPPSFKGVDLLMLGRQRPLFLMQNGQAVRADLGWGGVRAEGPLPGVPVGGLFAHAERVDRWRAAVKLSTADGRVRRSVQLHSRVPIAAVRLVGVDRRGDVVLALDRIEGADESAARAEVLLLALDPHGHLSGATSVPPGGRRYEFREFAIAPDGTVVQMQSDASEVRFVRWTLRSPPRDARSGEGIVRGRVIDGGRPAASATVTIPHLKRSVPVAADGTFEARVPAGTWLVAVRRPAAGPLDPGVDLRVAVAAGATVDVGNVSVAPRPPRTPPTPAATLAPTTAWPPVEPAPPAGGAPGGDAPPGEAPGAGDGMRGP